MASKSDVALKQPLITETKAIGGYILIVLYLCYYTIRFLRSQFLHLCTCTTGPLSLFANSTLIASANYLGKRQEILIVSVAIKPKG